MNRTIPRFSIRQSMFALILVAIVFVVDSWLLSHTQLASRQWLGTLKLPYHFSGFFMFVAPVLSVCLFLTMIVFWFQSRPFPLTPILFAGCFPIVFLRPFTAILEILLTLSVTASCVFLESLIRRSSWHTYGLSLCGFLIAGAYLLFIHCVDSVVSV